MAVRPSSISVEREMMGRITVGDDVAVNVPGMPDEILQ